MFTWMRVAVDRLRIGSSSSAAAADECASISPPRYRRPPPSARRCRPPHCRRERMHASEVQRQQAAGRGAGEVVRSIENMDMACVRLKPWEQGILI
jgi:hypothetical protein